jgi:hypothetical protein
MESGAPTVHGLDKLDIDSWASLTISTREILGRIIQDFDMFHPRFSVRTFENVPRALHEFPSNMGLFSRL